MVKVKGILVILYVLSCCPFTETCQSTGCMRADHKASLCENAKQKKLRYDLLFGGGTPIYGLYRYVPWDRVGFLDVLDP